MHFKIKRKKIFGKNNKIIKKPKFVDNDKIKIGLTLPKKKISSQKIKEIKIYASSQPLKRTNKRKSFLRLELNKNNKIPIYSKNPTNIKSINNKITNRLKLRQKNALKEFSNLIEIKTININSNTKKEINLKDSLGVKKTFLFKKIKTNKINVAGIKNLKIEKRKEKNDRKKFTKQYNSLVFQGKDPAKHMQNNAKISFSKFSKKNSILQKSSFGNIQKFVNERIDEEMQVSFKPNLNKEIFEDIKINKDKFLELGEKFFLYYAMIDENENVVDIEEVEVNRYSMQQNQIIPSIDFNINASVNYFNNSLKLSIQNLGKTFSKYKVYIKKINSFFPHETNNFEEVKTITLEPGEIVVNVFKENNIIVNSPIHIRVNPADNFNEYHNSKFDFVLPRSRYLKRKSFVGFAAETVYLDSQPEIKISLRGVDKSIKYVSLIKKEYYKNDNGYRNIPSLKKFKLPSEPIVYVPVLQQQDFNTTPTNSRINKHVFYMKNDADILVFSDSNIRTNTVYEYKAILIDEAGNQFKSGNSIVHYHVKPSKLFTVEANVNSNPASLEEYGDLISISDASIDNLSIDVSTSYYIDGKISNRQNDPEQLFEILQNLFASDGDYSFLTGVYQEEAVMFKRILNQIYTVNIVCTNVNTGEVLEVKRVNVDENKNFKVNLNLPSAADYLLRFNLSVLSIQDAFSNIAQGFENIFSNNGHYHRGQVAKDIANKIVSKQYSKFNVSSYQFAMINENVSEDQNLSIFEKNSTGDSYSLLLEGSNNIFKKNNSFSIEQKEISIIENNQNSLLTQVSFSLTGASNRIDYVVLFIYTGSIQTNDFDIVSTSYSIDDQYKILVPVNFDEYSISSVQYAAKIYFIDGSYSEIVHIGQITGQLLAEFKNGGVWKKI